MLWFWTKSNPDDVWDLHSTDLLLFPLQVVAHYSITCWWTLLFNTAAWKGRTFGKCGSSLQPFTLCLCPLSNSMPEDTGNKAASGQTGSVAHIPPLCCTHWQWAAPSAALQGHHCIGTQLLEEAPWAGTQELHRGVHMAHFYRVLGQDCTCAATAFLGDPILYGILCIPYVQWKHNQHKNNCTIQCTAGTGGTNLGLLSEELKQFFQPKPEVTPHILLMGCQWTDISAADWAPVLSFSPRCAGTECFAHSQFTPWYNKKMEGTLRSI